MLTSLFCAAAALYVAFALRGLLARPRGVALHGQENLTAIFSAALSAAALARASGIFAASLAVRQSAERVELVALSAAGGLLVHLAVRWRPGATHRPGAHASAWEARTILLAHGAALASALAAAADGTSGVTSFTLLGLATAPLAALVLLRAPRPRPDAAPSSRPARERTMAWALVPPLLSLLHDAAAARGFSPLPRFAAASFVPAAALASGPFALGAFAPWLGSRRAAFDTQTAQLDESVRELARVNAQLHDAQEELARKEQLAVVGELAAVIAHEVRNPLAIIANAVAGLRRPSLSRKDRDTLHVILDEETSRLNRLVADLLRYARPLAIQREHVPVKALVERGFALVRAHGRAQLRLEVRSDVNGDAHLWGDANLLRQVFDNLIENAVQAMQQAGVLTVRVRRTDLGGHNGLSIDVIDTGEGMDTMVRARAKDPFFTTRPSGTGLGLAIVDRIVEAHGGKFSIHSRSGEGTTATVFLPGESLGSAASALLPRERLAAVRTGSGGDAR